MDSEITMRWRIGAVGTGTRHKMALIVFETCTRDQACFRLFSVFFMRLILPTQKFILGKSAKVTKNKVSQYLMRF